MTQIAVQRKAMTLMELTTSEQKLLLRLRMLRKSAGAPAVMLLTINPLSLAVVGNLERLEECAFASSGSGLGGI